MCSVENASGEGKTKDGEGDNEAARVMACVEAGSWRAQKKQPPGDCTQRPRHPRRHTLIEKHLSVRSDLLRLPGIRSLILHASCASVERSAADQRPAVRIVQSERRAKRDTERNIDHAGEWDVHKKVLVSTQHAAAQGFGGCACMRN